MLHLLGFFIQTLRWPLQQIHHQQHLKAHSSRSLTAKAKDQVSSQKSSCQKRRTVVLAAFAVFKCFSYVGEGRQFTFRNGYIYLRICEKLGSISRRPAASNIKGLKRKINVVRDQRECHSLFARLSASQDPTLYKNRTKSDSSSRKMIESRTCGPRPHNSSS